jgi:Flp pilus assembly pilin Flp
MRHHLIGFVGIALVIFAAVNSLGATLNTNFTSINTSLK